MLRLGVNALATRAPNQLASSRAMCTAKKPFAVIVAVKISSLIIIIIAVITNRPINRDKRANQPGRTSQPTGTNRPINRD